MIEKPCVECGGPKDIAYRTMPRCRPCYDGAYTRYTVAFDELSDTWPELPRRMRNSLAWGASRDHVPADQTVTWAEHLSDEAFLDLLGLGLRGLVLFRRLVPEPS